jgi:hypothetical protein
MWGRRLRILVAGHAPSPCCPLVRSVVRWMATSGFPSGRGYHSSRRSFRRTDGRRRSLYEAPRPSATGEGCPNVNHGPPRHRIHHFLRGRPTVHPVGCSSSRFRSSSMPSRMKDEAFLYFVYGTSCLIKSHVS